MKVTIIGGGAWGTAMAITLAARHPVMVWDRDADVIRSAQANRENTIALPGFPLPKNLSLTDDFEEALAHVDTGNSLLVSATSVSGLRPVAEKLKSHTVSNLIWLCKGFEEKTGLLPHQIVAEILGPDVQTGVLSGPSFAQEVAAGLPCALTIASGSSDLCKHVVNVANFSNMRIYMSHDVTGVEVGGAIKNILAVATGMSDGLGLGANARAALITRGLAEITRLGVALGGKSETFMGLTGLGDLILTCTGDLSRNRKVGLLLAKGQSLSGIIEGLGHVAEGVRCAQVVRELAEKLKVEMPISYAVASVLFDGTEPKAAVGQLLSREVREETDNFYHNHT